MIEETISPGFKARMIGLAGWFSTNILGNRDGEVLDDPGPSRPRKNQSEVEKLEELLRPALDSHLELVA